MYIAIWCAFPGNNGLKAAPVLGVVEIRDLQMSCVSPGNAAFARLRIPKILLDPPFAKGEVSGTESRLERCRELQQTPRISINFSSRSIQP